MTPGSNREQSYTASKTERLIHALLGTHHPCATCRDEARAGTREPTAVREGTRWREASEPGGFRTRVCEEHGGTTE